VLKRGKIKILKKTNRLSKSGCRGNIKLDGQGLALYTKSSADKS